MSTQWPRISIVTPSYNQAPYLEQTIKSVLNQEYPNLEYIIIDGGSSDGSLEIIKKYESHLAYWCTEKDRGHYHAVNKGFERSTGEIMAWINSDDMYCPWAFRTVGSIFRQFSNVRWITTLNQMIWNQDGLCAFIKTLPGFSPQAFSDGANIRFGSKTSGFIQQESTFWRRSLWAETEELDLALNLASDFDLWARFFEHAQLYGVVSPLAGFRVHSKNRSKDKFTYSAEAQQSLKRFRERNPHFVNNSRRMVCNFKNYVPVLGRRIKIYSAKNIHLSSLEEGDEWIIRNQKF